MGNCLTQDTLITHTYTTRHKRWWSHYLKKQPDGISWLDLWLALFCLPPPLHIVVVPFALFFSIRSIYSVDSTPAPCGRRKDVQYSRHIVSTNQFKYGGIADSASSLSSVSFFPLCVRVVVADRKRALAYAKLNLRLITFDRDWSKGNRW